VVERFYQKSAGTRRRVEHRFAKPRVSHSDHEAHDRAGRVELAGVPRRVAHLAKHAFVEGTERVQLVA
jgi:hypothetical protein